jgi:hypothetical protein
MMAYSPAKSNPNTNNGDNHFENDPRYVNDEQEAYFRDKDNGDIIVVPPFSLYNSSGTDSEDKPPPHRPPPLKGQLHKANSKDSSEDLKLNLNKRYLYSLYGIVRILILLSIFVGWISVLAVIKLVTGPIDSNLPYNLASSRLTYIIFGIIEFIISLIIFVFNLFHIIDKDLFSRVPWSLVVLITDILCFIPMFIFGIVCGIAESTISDIERVSVLSVSFNRGAFGVASVSIYLILL